jgi:hypothetical protein
MNNPPIIVLFFDKKIVQGEISRLGSTPRREINGGQVFICFLQITDKVCSVCC